MPTPKLIPFYEFIESLHSVRPEEIAENAEFRAKSPDHFEEMRQHLIAYYDSITPKNSFKDDHGQVWDCIPADQQPSVRRSGKALAKPISIPGAKTQSREGNLFRPMISRGGTDDEGNVRSCQDGCIPIRRITLEEISRFNTLRDFFRKAPRNTRQTGKDTPPDASPEDDPTAGHRWSHAYQSVANIGGHSFLNIWQPAIVLPQVFSLSQHWYTAGQRNGTQTLEAGWQVFPTKYKTNVPCLFIYWTADYYNQTGSYNNEDSKFFQTSNQWALGEALPNVSVAGGEQAEIEISWFLNDGNWWLYINGTTDANAIGYYPASIYNGGPMATAADSIDYGGEVFGNNDWSPMGSGAFAAAGTGQSAYQRNILYYTLADTFDAALNPSQEWPNCFTIAPGTNAEWGSFFYFGGPGGNNCFTAAKNRLLPNGAIDINATMADTTKTISDRVKIAILFEAGFNNPIPATLDPTTQLSGYNFDNADFVTITNYFNRIIVVQKPGAIPLDPTDVANFSTVQNCIDSVTQASS